MSCALPGGGFASAQDADTDGVEGLTFTWTEDDGLRPSCSSPSSTAARSSAASSSRSCARACWPSASGGRSPASTTRRSRPGTGSRSPPWPRPAGCCGATTGSSGCGAPPRSCCPLFDDDGRLRRSWRDGRTSGAGFLDDYANVAHGLLELHVATGELRWLTRRGGWPSLAVELFADDERGGFFLTPAGGEELIARTKDLEDNPLPSGNSMLAHVLLRLARLWGDDEFERRAVSVFRLVAPALTRAPGGFAWALCGLALYLSPPRELAVVGPVDSPVARAALDRWQPATVVAIGPSDDVPLLAGKTLVDGREAVYACERFACQAPVTDPADL